MSIESFENVDAVKKSIASGQLLSRSAGNYMPQIKDEIKKALAPHRGKLVPRLMLLQEVKSIVLQKKLSSKPKYAYNYTRNAIISMIEDHALKFRQVESNGVVVDFVTLA